MRAILRILNLVESTKVSYKIDKRLRTHPEFGPLYREQNAAHNGFLVSLIFWLVVLTLILVVLL